MVKTLDKKGSKKNIRNLFKNGGLNDDLVIYKNIDFIKIKYTLQEDFNFISGIKENSESFSFNDSESLKINFFQKFSTSAFWFVSSKIGYLKQLIQIQKNFNSKNEYQNGLYLNFYGSVFSDYGLWFFKYFIELIQKRLLDYKYINYNRIDFCVDFKDIDVKDFIDNFKPGSGEISTKARVDKFGLSDDKNLGIYTNYFRYSTDEWEIVFYNKILDVVEKGKDKTSDHYKKYVDYNQITRLEYREKRRKLKKVDNITTDNMQKYMLNNCLKVVKKYFNIKNINVKYYKNTKDKLLIESFYKKKLENDKKMLFAYFNNVKNNPYAVNTLSKLSIEIDDYLINHYNTLV